MGEENGMNGRVEKVWYQRERERLSDLLQLSLFVAEIAKGSSGISKNKIATRYVW